MELGTCVDGLSGRIAQTTGRNQQLEAEANSGRALAEAIDEITKFISHRILFDEETKTKLKREIGHKQWERTK